MKNFMVFVLFIFVVGTVSSEPDLISAIRIPNWQYFDEVITTTTRSEKTLFLSRLFSGLFTWNRNELRIVRNAFYARHGYRFNSPDLQNYFNQFAWYNGTEENVDHLLSDSEKNFISLIQRIEMNYPQSINDNIIGHWSPIDYLGYHPMAIYSGRQIKIFPNGTFFYSEDYWPEYSRELTVDFYGLWSFSNNEFKITPLSDDVGFFGDINIIINNINKNIRFNYYFYYGKSFTESNFTNDSTRWIRIVDHPNNLFDGYRE
jgi:hypothetical protein